MNGMKLAFYKGKGNWVDLIIRVFTNSPYSHVEIVLNKDWYSSSPRDGGVRVKQIVDDVLGLDSPSKFSPQDIFILINKGTT